MRHVQHVVSVLHVSICFMFPNATCRLSSPCSCLLAPPPHTVRGHVPHPSHTTAHRFTHSQAPRSSRTDIRSIRRARSCTVSIVQSHAPHPSHNHALHSSHTIMRCIAHGHALHPLRTIMLAGHAGNHAGTIMLAQSCWQGNHAGAIMLAQSCWQGNHAGRACCLSARAQAFWSGHRREQSCGQDRCPLGPHPQGIDAAQVWLVGWFVAPSSGCCCQPARVWIPCWGAPNPSAACWSGKQPWPRVQVQLGFRASLVPF